MDVSYTAHADTFLVGVKFSDYLKYLLVSSPPVPRWGNLSLISMMDTDLGQATCAHCAGVVNLVCDGDISVKDGVARLVLSRQAGTPEQRSWAVSALRVLAHNPDSRIAHVAQCAILELRNYDMWQLFTKYYEEREQMRREYNEIIMAVQRNPASPEIVPDQTRDDDVGSLESF